MINFGIDHLKDSRSAYVTCCAALVIYFPTRKWESGLTFRILRRVDVLVDPFQARLTKRMWLVGLNQWENIAGMFTVIFGGYAGRLCIRLYRHVSLNFLVFSWIHFEDKLFIVLSFLSSFIWFIALIILSLKLCTWLHG